MAMLNQRPKKSFTPPGIGRGHSSLPPKPGFPGKPLPRDTDAIVLTPGAGESMTFSAAKPKRTYSSVASETVMRPMDPAVTNLTPQNRVGPHHQSITPPAESKQENHHSVGSPRSPPAGPRSRVQSMDGSNFDAFPNGTLDAYPMGHQFHPQNGPFFHPYSGTLTPPNTGNLFVPPPAMHPPEFSNYAGLQTAEHSPQTAVQPFLPSAAALRNGSPIRADSASPEVARDPRLFNISFVAPDVGPENGVNGAAGSLDSYALSQFLSDNLADVSLVLIDPHSQETEKFPAHSFVLGRSLKLAGLLQSAFGSETVTVDAASTWDESIDNLAANLAAVKIVCSPHDHATTLTFGTSVSREAFLLVLKSLYGAPEWEMDAFVDPSHPHDPSLSKEVAMLERSIQVFVASVILGVDIMAFKAVEGIRRWGLTLEGGAFERLVKLLSLEANELRSSSVLRSNHWNFVQPLLHEAIVTFCRNLPEDFKLDTRAPNSKYLLRPSHDLMSTPRPLEQMQLIRQVHSTILLSVPFEILKLMLEQESLSVNGTKKRFDLALAVIQEREKRRKRELKAIQDQKDPGHEVLYWEESVVSTFGHGAIGIEITKRKKGGPGGRMLWKVGKQPTN
jgi:hypothetical protein